MLTPENKSALYSDRFMTNARTVMGEQGHMILDLRTQLDVANAEIGVLNDELKATQAERDELKAYKEAAEAPKVSVGSGGAGGGAA